MKLLFYSGITLFFFNGKFHVQNDRPDLQTLIQLKKIQFLSEICEDFACKEL